MQAGSSTMYMLVVFCKYASYSIYLFWSQRNDWRHRSNLTEGFKIQKMSRFSLLLLVCFLFFLFCKPPCCFKEQASYNVTWYSLNFNREDWNSWRNWAYNDFLNRNSYKLILMTTDFTMHNMDIMDIIHNTIMLQAEQFASSSEPRKIYYLKH